MDYHGKSKVKRKLKEFGLNGVKGGVAMNEENN